MINEDSTKALYCDPNAYIQTFKMDKKEQSKKVVFSEPYETLPNYYINNNFKKGDCECVKSNNDFISKQKCDECNHQHKPYPQFDFKALLPILGMISGGGDSSQLTKLLGDNSQSGFNPMSLVLRLINNKEGLSNILNIFKNVGLNKNSKSNKEIKSTDFEIKNYTRVE